MLMYCLVFIYFTHIGTSAEVTKKLQEEQTTIHRSTVQRAILKARSQPVKLTFQTLYPKFMSTWSSNKIIRKQTKDKIHNTEQGRRNSITKIMNGTEPKTIEGRAQKHNAFIEVEAMRRYVPMKITTSKNITQTRKVRNPLKRSQHSALNNFNVKQKYRNIRTKVIKQEIATDDVKPLNSFKQHLQRKRFSTNIPTSYTLQILNVVPNKETQRTGDTDRQTNEQEVFNRLQKLQNDLKNIRSDVKNGSVIINNLKVEVQEKDNNEFVIKHKTSFAFDVRDNKGTDDITVSYSNNNKEQTTAIVKVTNQKTTRKEGHEVKHSTRTKLNKHQRRLEWLKQHFLGATGKENENSNFLKNIDEEKQLKPSSFIENNSLKNIRQRDKGIDNINKLKMIQTAKYLTSRDPLAYDSLEVALEHDIAMKELTEMLDQNSLTVKQDTAKDTLRTRKYDRRLFNIGKITSREPAPTMKSDDIDQIFAPKPGYNITAVLNVKGHNNIDHNTEISDRGVSDRLDTAGIKRNIGTHNKFNNIDYVKYVDHVMQQNSLPLLERRNIIKKTVDEKLNDLYKRHNLVANNMDKEHFDTALKAIGANLYK